MGNNVAVEAPLVPSLSAGGVSSRATQGSFDNGSLGVEDSDTRKLSSFTEGAESTREPGSHDTGSTYSSKSRMSWRSSFSGSQRAKVAAVGKRLSLRGSKVKEDLSSALVRYSSVQLGTLVALWHDVRDGRRANQVELYVTTASVGRLPEGTTVSLVNTSSATYTVSAPWLASKAGGTFELHESKLKPKPRSDWTLEDVCLFVVLPLTQNDASFFQDWLLPEAVGNAFDGSFVTVPRETEMDLAMDALAHECSARGEPSSRTFVWIDVFCANQPKLMKRKSGGTLTSQVKEGVLANLVPAVKKFQDTIVILDSWEAPRALTRAWCVWELYVGALGGRELHCVFTDDVRQSTAEWLDNDAGFSLLNAVNAMDMSTLESENEGDLGALMEAMHGVRGGFTTIKRAVHARFKRWLMRDIEASVRRTRASCVETSEDESFAFMLANAGRFLRQIGEYHNALNYFRICRQVYKRTRGTDDPNYGAACNSMASVLRQLGKYAEALELFEEDLAVVKAVHGAGHHEVARVLNNIANCYAEQGDFPEALRLSNEALSILRNTVGEDHEEVAETLQNMAIMYTRQDEFELAIEYYEEVLEVLSRLHGPEAVPVSDVLVKIAGTHLRMGDSDRALELMTEALKLRRKALGSRHPSVAKTLVTTAKIHEERGEMLRAVELTQKAAEIYDDTLGSHDTAALKTRRYLKHLSSTATKAATKANMRSYLRQNI